MKRWLSRLKGSAFFAVMMLGSVLITLSSLVYFEPDTLAPFVIEKLPLRYEELWLRALKVHVASAIVSFPLCLVLMTRWLQRKKTWHRWIGRITGLTTVGVLVPSGLILSLEAKGGTWVTIGFVLSGLIVLFATILGVVYARKAKPALHARAMRHVVAQMSVAVTSRALLIALDGAGMNPDTAYVLALWGPVVASALVAEWVSGALPSLINLYPTHPLTRSLS